MTIKFSDGSTCKYEASCLDSSGRMKWNSKLVATSPSAGIIHEGYFVHGFYCRASLLGFQELLSSSSL